MSARIAYSFTLYVSQQQENGIILVYVYQKQLLAPKSHKSQIRNTWNQFNSMSSYGQLAYQKKKKKDYRQLSFCLNLYSHYLSNIEQMHRKLDQVLLQKGYYTPQFEGINGVQTIQPTVEEMLYTIEVWYSRVSHFDYCFN